MANTQQQLPVLIVGAGPTGLVLALCLARQGIRFRIVDRASGPGLASRAMAVQARTLELYDQLGIADAVLAQGIRMEQIHMRSGGTEFVRLQLGELGASLSPYPFALCFAQDEHERFLVERLRAEGVEVEWGVELDGLEQDAQGVRARLVGNGREQSCHAAWLCGADGAHSAVRQCLGLGFPGGTYEQRFYVADVQLAGPGSDDLFASLGAGALGLVLPVRRSGMKRLIGTVPPALVGRDDELTFAELQPFIESLVDVRVEQLNWFSTYKVHHRVAERFRVGRVFIAGDAGHVHSPAGGQGMNTGIGDAFNLAWKLAEVIRGRAAPGLLDSYEPERIAFARKLVETTDRVFQGMVSQHWGGRLLRTRLLPLLAPMATELAPVRRAMFRTISQIRINYRNSAASEGQAGQVHGGDRLPWVPSAEGGNFGSLRGLVWRIHVYGSASPSLAAAARRLGLPIDRFAWDAAALQAGLECDAAYLLRPDGHVALAWSDQGVARLEAFIDRLALKPG
ncbi:FAD-dependent monooxygenase [Rivibacter subsaxonicus]|uniref:2-polyprenyl-6-methoxyphenol hydroxylase-like FAD-dependent oxidoreductase n=1 Tax=Rivibacter subsaxonicus TaxID=457575 RepID=A0A4Q7W124_9BURK|nr:FAD-dependent monooxygenase [Rivibacter subsaxonicus]RZU02897.1 2-polyprenyl-6-methoxyphenol hydroxylase-like FAD-dependent oxidoreductase [Rivibacter subsaxonicus]